MNFNEIILSHNYCIHVLNSSRHSYKRPLYNCSTQHSQLFCKHTHSRLIHRIIHIIYIILNLSLFHLIRVAVYSIGYGPRTF